MSFAADIAKWADKAGSTMDESVRTIRLQAVELVIEKMPVDTGQTKGSVMASIGTPASGQGQPDNSPLKHTDVARARADSVIKQDTDNIFYYTSNSPNIWVLEHGGYGRGPGATNKTTRDGFSVQAPNGMFKISAIQLRQGVKDAIKNA